MFRLTTAAALCACISTSAYGQGLTCGPHDEMAEDLAEKYGERRSFQGVGAFLPGAQNLGPWLFEVWVDPQDGSWTWVGTDPSGNSCIFAAGNSGERIAPEPAGLRL